MDLISSFRTFIRVAETESFSAVAREFRIGQPAISKQISALEEHLGARLLQRSTRSLALTDEGVEFLSQARAAVEAADEAVERMRGRDGHVSGVLRMTTSASFARMHIVPRLHLLGRRHPELRVDLVLQLGQVGTALPRIADHEEDEQGQDGQQGKSSVLSSQHQSTAPVL